MNWIQLIAAVGVGAIITKILDVLWLQRVMQDSERRKWLRDQRLQSFASLSKVIISEGGISYVGKTSLPEAKELIAETIMLLPNEKATLAELMEGYFPDVEKARSKLSQFINNGTSTTEERAKMKEDEEKRLHQKAQHIIKELRNILMET